jgi:hypothetical protein
MRSRLIPFTILFLLVAPFFQFVDHQSISLAQIMETSQLYHQ